jgi:hypothetical protein
MNTSSANFRAKMAAAAGGATRGRAVRETRTRRLG